MKINIFAGLLILLLSLNCAADRYQFQKLRIEEREVLEVRLTLNSEAPQLQLFWKDETGKPFKTFSRLQSWLASKKKTLLFAINSGIYGDTPDFFPIGLHVENGILLKRLSFANGCGNFCWYSGVAIVRNNELTILPRESVKKSEWRNARFALQSGPLFLSGGKLQGSWSKESRNRNRSAVCTTKSNAELKLILVTSFTNFQEFSDVLIQRGCRTALFLDGEVSSFYDGKMGRTYGRPEKYAGILALIE